MRTATGLIESLVRMIEETRRRLDRLETVDTATWVMLTAPLTSTSWDGDAFSTTAKTVIDLSSVFSVPANAKAVLVSIAVRDSASAATNNLFVGVAPNNTADEVAMIARPSGLPNDYFAETEGVCPCNADGDIYYQVAASGAGTMDVWLQVWGYLL